jgi:hypothetical protein
MTHALEILKRLTEPGQTLLFCDDTDIDSALGFVPNIRILCALRIRSEDYASAAPTLSNELEQLGQREFHATEVVNPGSRSSWKLVSLTDRLRVFKLVGDLISIPTTRLYYIFISKGQYEQLRSTVPGGSKITQAYKTGLKIVFLETLLDQLDDDGNQAVLVMDQDRPMPAPKIQEHARGSLLRGGGPIYAQSKDLIGLQFADMAALAVSRFARRRRILETDLLKPFDEVIVKTLAAFSDRCIHLLNREAV